MMDGYTDIARLIGRVRARWRFQHACRAAVRMALSIVAGVTIALVATGWTVGAPRVLAAIVTVSALVALGAIGWSSVPLRRRPTDAQVARFVEERSPELEDRLVTAVHAGTQSSQSPFHDLLIADA